MNKQDLEQAAARAKEKAVFARVKQNQQEETDRAAHEAVNEGRAPYEVLGRDGKNVVLYSRDRGGIVHLPAERVTASALFLRVAKEETLKAWRPEWADMTDRQLASAVVKDIAHKLGSRVYNPARVRGAGIWHDSEGVLYSTGQECFLLREGESEPRPVYPMRPDGFLYAAEECKAGMPFPAAHPLTPAEGKELAAFLAARSWAEPYAAEIMAGWLVCSLLAGLLPVRPHVWINGARGKGKGCLFKDLSTLYGGGCHAFAGAETTPAGMRNTADGNALPVLFDESETDGRDRKAERMRDLLSMTRLSFDGNQASPRAKEGGGVKAARLRSCFCLASIRDFLESEADFNRFHLLNLLPADASELAELERRQAERRKLASRADTPARLLALAMQQAGFILRNADTIAARLKSAEMESRRAVMNGLLLAGRWALTDGGEVSAEYLAHCDAVAGAAEEKAQGDSAPIWAELQDVILSYPCLNYPMKKNVRQAVQAVIWTQGGTEEGAVNLAELAKSALESIGIHPCMVDLRRKDNRAGQWCVIADYRSKAFAPVAERSKWKGGHGIPAAVQGAPHMEVRKCRLNGINTTHLVIYEPAFRDDPAEE